jgi:hypothetical protein
MNEKTEAYSSLLVAVEALAEEAARTRAARGEQPTTVTDGDLTAIAEQLGRQLTPVELTAVKAAYAAEARRISSGKLVVRAAGAVHVPVRELLGRRGADGDDVDLEQERLPGQRVVPRHQHAVFFDDHDRVHDLVFFLEGVAGHEAEAGLEPRAGAVREGLEGDLQVEPLVVDAVAGLGRDAGVDVIARLVAPERLFEAGDNLPTAVKVDEGLVLLALVDRLTLDGADPIVKRDDRVIGYLHRG